MNVDDLRPNVINRFKRIGLLLNMAGSKNRTTGNTDIVVLLSLYLYFACNIFFDHFGIWNIIHILFSLVGKGTKILFCY